jgi:hypothetical protein
VFCCSTTKLAVMLRVICSASKAPCSSGSCVVEQRRRAEVVPLSFVMLCYFCRESCSCKSFSLMWLVHAALDFL